MISPEFEEYWHLQFDLEDIHRKCRRCGAYYYCWSHEGAVYSINGIRRHCEDPVALSYFNRLVELCGSGQDFGATGAQLMELREKYRPTLWQRFKRLWF